MKRENVTVKGSVTDSVIVTDGRGLSALLSVIALTVAGIVIAAAVAVVLLR